MADNYVRVDATLPPEGVIVETVSPGGIVQELNRQGRLCFTSDGAMYVYYTPILWRPSEQHG